MPSRTKKTSGETTSSCLEPGTFIISDIWKAYNGIPEVEGMRFEHQTVNHNVNFGDPTSVAHTQTIENFWWFQTKMHKEKNYVHCKRITKFIFV